MTPDELRRMDVDDCIIFVKGVRPIKSKKFYYFQKPMAKELANTEISHNDIGEIERGEWRKFNPYNPYVEEENKTEDLKVESLDDLFEQPQEKPINIQEEKQDTVNSEQENIQIPNIEEDDDVMDLQKELEAKFDELFGSLEENE